MLSKITNKNIVVISSKEDRILTKLKFLTIPNKYLSMSKKIEIKLKKSLCNED